MLSFVQHPRQNTPETRNSTREKLVFSVFILFFFFLCCALCEEHKYFTEQEHQSGYLQDKINDVQLTMSACVWRAGGGVVKGRRKKKPTAVLQFDLEYPNLDSDFTNRNKKKELIDCGAMARLNTREQQLHRSKPVNYSIERIKQINKERHKIPVSSAVISPFLVTFMLQEGEKIIMAVVHLTRKLPTMTTLNTVINLQSEPVTFLSSSV